jgi:hypothetical protein
MQQRASQAPVWYRDYMYLPMGAYLSSAGFGIGHQGYSADYNEYAQDEDEDDYEFNSMIEDLVGKVEIGVEDVDLVTSVVHDTRTIETEGGASCPICRETFADILNDALLTTTTVHTQIRQTLCQHMFCAPCITKWLQSHKKCPSCMQDLQDMYDDANHTLGVTPTTDQFRITEESQIPEFPSH